MSRIPSVLMANMAAIGLGCMVGLVDAAPIEINDFNAGPEGWQVYDYNGLPFGTEGGSNVFHPVTWEESGGVGNSGYVWGDDSRWRIDTPETPDSILSFILYRSWVEGQALDLRNAHFSVYLRGDNLDLNGATVNFWVLNHALGARYHYVSHPLQISDGTWNAKQSFILENDESLWHNSWQRNPSDPASLRDVLSVSDSYGFSFLGFPMGVGVTGKFSMDELVIFIPEPGTAGLVATGGLVLLATMWRRRRISHVVHRWLGDGGGKVRDCPAP